MFTILMITEKDHHNDSHLIITFTTLLRALVFIFSGALVTTFMLHHEKYLLEGS